MSYGVRSISVGTFEEPGPAVFWQQRFDEWITLRLQLVLIEGEGRTIARQHRPAGRPVRAPRRVPWGAHVAAAREAGCDDPRAG